MMGACIKAVSGRGTGGTDLKYIFEMELRGHSNSLMRRIKEKEEPSITPRFLE